MPRLFVNLLCRIFERYAIGALNEANRARPEPRGHRITTAAKRKSVAELVPFLGAPYSCQSTLQGHSELGPHGQNPLPETGKRIIAGSRRRSRGRKKFPSSGLCRMNYGTQFRKDPRHSRHERRELREDQEWAGLGVTLSLHRFVGVFGVPGQRHYCFGEAKGTAILPVRLFDARPSRRHSLQKQAPCLADGS